MEVRGIDACVMSFSSKLALVMQMTITGTLRYLPYRLVETLRWKVSVLVTQS